MILSITALALGVLNAAFAAYQWRRSIGTRVNLTMAPMILAGSGPAESVVVVKMVNVSQHEVAVSHLSFKQEDSDVAMLVARPLPVHEPLPILISPHRSKTVWVPEKTLEQHKHDRLRAHISTEDDHDFYSEWVVLANTS